MQFRTIISDPEYSALRSRSYRWRNTTVSPISPPGDAAKHPKPCPAIPNQTITPSIIIGRSLYFLYAVLVKDLVKEACSSPDDQSCLARHRTRVCRALDQCYPRTCIIHHKTSSVSEPGRWCRHGYLFFRGVGFLRFLTRRNNDNRIGWWHIV